MQYGSLRKERRKCGADVWTFRWRERDGGGKSVYRRLTVGTTNQFEMRSAARKAVAGIVREINFNDGRIRMTPMTLAELVDHYRQHELARDNARITYSTKRAYEGYLRKWVLPRWGNYALTDLMPVEVEAWLRGLGRAPATCAKLRNLMSVLFNHARRQTQSVRSQPDQPSSSERQTS